MKLRVFISSLFVTSLLAGGVHAEQWHPRHDRPDSVERFNPRPHDRDRRDHDRRDHDRRDRDDHRGHRHDRDRDRDHRHGKAWHCPPGLAKKGRDCVPPGHKKHHHKHHQYRVGERFRPSDYDRVQDMRLYKLEQRRNWDYYRDNDQIYRVDNNTQKVLGVINLMQALRN